MRSFPDLPGGRNFKLIYLSVDLRRTSSLV